MSMIRGSMDWVKEVKFKSSAGSTDSGGFNGKLRKNLMEFPKLDDLIDFPVLDLPETPDDGQNCVYFRSANASAWPNANTSLPLKRLRSPISRGISAKTRPIKAFTARPTRIDTSTGSQ